jgi:excinuclease UvrABC nuclease subunit
MDEALLQQHVEFAAGGWDSVRLNIPAGWAVAILIDENDSPVQLLCLKDIRGGLDHRFAEEASSGKRVDWRKVARAIRWQIVASSFEADWVYLQAARTFFPETWQDLVPKGEAQFVHIDPEEEFPHYVRTTEIEHRGVLIGPLPEKAPANRLIELLADVFDLCRYHHILVQAPLGKACAYKEMGKCPAPCDGSISIAQYRRLIEMSLTGLMDPEALIAEQTQRMSHAAAELRFETATRIKAFIKQLEELSSGPLRLARPIEQFAFVTVQPAIKPVMARVYLILPGRIEHVACFFSEPAAADLIEAIQWQAGQSNDPADPAILALLTRHIFSRRKAEGVFFPLAELDEARISQAFKAVVRSRRRARAVDKMVVPPEAGRA